MISDGVSALYWNGSLGTGMTARVAEPTIRGADGSPHNVDTAGRPLKGDSYVFHFFDLPKTERGPYDHFLIFDRDLYCRFAAVD